MYSVIEMVNNIKKVENIILSKHYCMIMYFFFHVIFDKHEHFLIS